MRLSSYGPLPRPELFGKVGLLLTPCSERMDVRMEAQLLNELGQCHIRKRLVVPAARKHKISAVQ